MDQAFAPGSTAQDGRLRRMFTARANTSLQTPAGGTSIKDFFDFLKASNLTADDLVVGSHASDEGFLLIELDATHTNMPTSYEDVDDVDSTGSIHIPPAIRTANTSFHFKGCNIGSEIPFLTLLKHALDNPQQVTAPRFFHGLYEFFGVGIFEFMGHNYRVISKDAFSTRAALVSKFQSAGLTRLDGTPVPNTDIDKWVSRRLSLSPRTSDKRAIPFPVKIVPKTGGKNAIDDPPAECRSKREQYTYQLDTGSAPPAGKAARIAAMKPFLAAEADQQSTHPYPLYARLHYATFDDFFDGQNWTVTLNGTTQNWVGTHFVYTLVIPIVKPGTTDELIFNFYPNAKTANIAAAPAGAVRASDVVTIKTTAPHTFAVDDMVTVDGVDDSGFDGTFQIASVPSPTTFTYSQVDADATSGSGTVKSAPTMNFLENNAAFNLFGQV